MHSSDRTGEVVDCFGCADAINIDEHPVKHSDLSDGGNESGNELELEEEPWRDLHVLSKFEVGGELDTLR